MAATTDILDSQAWKRNALHIYTHLYSTVLSEKISEQEQSERIKKQET